MSEASVSVCIATYNGSLYIKEQIDSILKQLDFNDEIIISDDCSTDNTVAIIYSFNDNRIRFFQNNYSKGYTNNFINAIEKCNNELIFLSDQDDVWMENKVELCKHHFANGYKMIISDAKVVDKNLITINESFFHARNSKAGFFNNLIKTGYLGCTIAFKKSILIKLFPFPKNRKLIPHDLWIGMYCMMFYKVKWLKTPLIYYRRHSSNVSDGGFSVSNLTFKDKIKLRALLIMNLILRIL